MNISSLSQRRSIALRIRIHKASPADKIPYIILSFAHQGTSMPLRVI